MSFPRADLFPAQMVVGRDPHSSPAPRLPSHGGRSSQGCSGQIEALDHLSVAQRLRSLGWKVTIRDDFIEGGWRESVRNSLEFFHLQAVYSSLILLF